MNLYFVFLKKTTNVYKFPSHHQQLRTKKAYNKTLRMNHIWQGRSQIVGENFQNGFNKTRKLMLIDYSVLST